MSTTITVVLCFLSASFGAGLGALVMAVIAQGAYSDLQRYDRERG